MEQEIFTLTFTKKEMQEIAKIMETCLMSLEQMLRGVDLAQAGHKENKAITGGKNMYRNYIKKFSTK